MKRLGVAALIVALVLAQSAPALAYLKMGANVGGRSVVLKWKQAPINYFVSDRGLGNVGPQQLQAAVARAFSSWHSVPTAAVDYRFVGFTSAQPLDEDGISTVGFLDRPELDRVLASTSLLIDNTTGELLETDIFFNAAFTWSVAPQGEPGRFDLESIALHEIGHLNGLGHSALGETELFGGGRRVIAADAVMFPIAFPAGNTAGRTLRDDDIAGISDLYPAERFSSQTGSLSGRVTLAGRGIFGAHVVAFNPATGALVGNFSLDQQGSFAIAGLSPGPHVVRVEPLDDAEVDGFFSAAADVSLDFRVTFFDRLVVVPRAGSTGSIEIQVRPK